MVTKKALEILNCNPSIPDDGHSYTDFVDIECEAGICRCDENDSIFKGAALGIQQRLKPFSIIILVVFSFGFPFLLCLIIRCNEHNIKIDQLLRAYNINPNIVASLKNVEIVRDRYHKMYYYFKPGKIYWIINIIVRKGLIAFVGFVYNKNPSFQFSCTVLVLFVSFVGAVKHHPYMSTAERKYEIIKHQIKVDEKDENHIFIDKLIKTALDKGKYENSRKLGKITKMSFDSSTNERRKSTASKNNKFYFFDYNTVERVLLASSIIVALAGIMFESGRFNDRTDLIQQRDFIAIVVLIVIILSLIYYSVVFVAEVFAATPEWLIRCFSEKKKINNQYSHNSNSKIDNIYNMENGDYGDNEIEMTVNPAMLMHEASNEEKVKRKFAEDELEKVIRDNQTLQNRLRHAKKTNIKGISKKVGRGKKAKRKSLVEMSGGLSRGSKVSEDFE